MKSINFITQFELNNVYHSDCLVPVQRNNGLDAITIPNNERQAKNIKIQPLGVDLATCVRFAFKTMASKKFPHLLLIQASLDTSLTTDLCIQQYDLSRVTIIKSLDYQIQSSISELKL